MNETKITITVIICITCLLLMIIVLGIANSEYGIHISMDNNTLEAIKSINYTTIQ